MTKLKDGFILLLLFFGGLSLFKYLTCTIRNTDCSVDVWGNLFIAACITLGWLFIYPKKGITNK